MSKLINETWLMHKNKYWFFFFEQYLRSSDFKMSFANKIRTRTKVHCFCNKCNGALVDPKTRSKHRSINYKEAGPSRLLPDDDEMGDNEIEINYQEADEMDYNAMEYEP